ncbi:uncharacterized protein LOC119686164 isoform X1 [Teleopsis dalmanni]|uniref:uncharacterized protein LOC119686164 isoform X1 n=1 Tax=Teleopsis dalmanni TaxID=139649 RepID=UPI000D32B467|nr:uncharacterized protein LOC119686164 isoform X1 [Teleopsis dalmanni]XP_037956592.1 uncharacterized protein LOC119686164 isoform X1 [Teleopsis dalmanni]
MAESNVLENEKPTKGNKVTKIVHQQYRVLEDTADEIATLPPKSYNEQLNKLAVMDEQLSTFLKTAKSLMNVYLEGVKEWRGVLRKDTSMHPKIVELMKERKISTTKPSTKPSSDFTPQAENEDVEELN